MTVTEQQVLELEQNFVKEVDTHKNWNEFFWTFVEDPDSFVFVSESNNVYHGRKEIAPFFDARAKTNLKTGKEDDAARKILLNFYGPGQHVLQTLSEIVRETALAEGLPKSYKIRTVLHFGDDLKFTRMVADAGDDAARAMVDEFVKKTEAAAGVPEGGYPEAVELFKRAQKLTAGGWETSMSVVADDAINFSPTGSIVVGKDACGEAFKMWFGLGYQGYTIVSPIHTPAKNKAWAMVKHNWNPPRQTSAPIPPALMHYTFAENGDTQVLATITKDMTGSDWIGHEVMKLLAAKAAA